VFHALGATAVATSDRSFITNLVSAHETGLYFVGAQLAMTITFLADSFNRAYAPWLFEKLKEGNSEMMHRIQLGTYFYYAVIFLITALLILAGPLILKLIAGPKFFGASQYIFWLALANAFGSMYYMESLRIQFNGKTEYLAFITLTIGTLNILLCYFMTLREGAIGAAKATTISQLLIFLITWLVATKLIKNKMN
jgi:O-antigen/teichoic acid export membrane protein